MNKKVLLFVLGFAIYQNGIAQSVDVRNAKKFTVEVYANTEYAGPKYIEHNQSLLARTIIKKITSNPPAQYTNLSTVKLIDKYNAVERENASNFNPSTFNPLKYDLNYYSKTTEPIFYRVDHTDYYIIINPKIK